MSIKSPPKRNFFVSHIRVEKLFGHFDYDLDFKCEAGHNASRLGILYGDNGSGKTTILRLLFHLLSPIDNRGHKTELAQTKFSRFEVQLADGTTILAERSQHRLIGNLELRIAKSGKTICTLPMKVSEDGSVKMSGTPEAILVEKFLKNLRNLNVEILFMRDNRRLASNLDPNLMADARESGPQGGIMVEWSPENIIRHMNGPRENSLTQAVENVTKYFREHALAASSKGEINTNKIYDDIIKNLVAPGKPKLEYSESQFQENMEKFAVLDERNQAFVKVGLASPLLAKEMIGSLRKAKYDARPALTNVLKPYIDSVQARLDALNDIRHKIDQFTDSLNSFIGNGKVIVFSLGGGLQILGYDKDLLNPEGLSSGEKQILAMFCNIVCVQGRTAVFIIDEPELSLNIKWQRRIVQSLLDCAADSSVQFIMASHSMEVLSRHRDQIVQLVNTSAYEKVS